MCDQDLIHYLDTLKSLSVKIVKLLFATRVADETAYAQLPSFIVSKKKKKKQLETQKQVSHWMPENSSVKTERNWDDKWKSSKTKKRDDVQIKKLIEAPCEAIKKLLLKNICHQKMYIPAFC